jgi:hypothetical protein
MAIKVNNTTVIDDSRNINNIGVATATSFKGSAQVGVATGGTYIGLATQFNFVGSGVSIIHAYNSASGIATITLTSTGGSGGSGGGGGDFNTGITSITSETLVATGSTVLTLPSTAGRRYIIRSIHASNVSVGNTEVNVIGAFDFSGGQRSYFAYNIPIPTGTSVELLKQPQILNPSDRITMRATNYNRVGEDNIVQIYISYEPKTDTNYFGVGLGTAGIGVTSPVGVYTSTTYPSVIQSIRLANITDVGPYPVSVTVTSGVNTTYLVDDLIIPKYASVELLDAPKAIKLNDVISVIVDQTSTIDIQVSGIKVV